MSEVERDGIRDVSGGSSEAEQRGIRAAKRGERENVSNMNERSEYRNQNAEAPTTSAFDAPQVPPGIAPAANDEGASAGVISHNAPRQLNPMGKAIAVVLSVLLVLTCWNSYSIEEARRMIIGDDAVPMASTGSGDELLDEVDDENIDQASNDVEGEGDAAEGDDASGGKDADDTAADDTVSEADMQAYLPKDLLDAEKVMPALADATLKQEKDGILTPATTSEDDLKAAFANRFSFSLAVANALRASDDAYHVGGTNLAVAPSRQHERLLRRRIPGRRRGQRRRRSHVRGSLPVQEIRRKGMRTFFRASRQLARDSFCTASGSSSPATP